MNIFIKFSIIISTLIGLNSTLVVKIKINKEGLKKEPKIFEGKDGGEFRVKLAKWSNGKWEYADKSEYTKYSGPWSINAPVALELPEEWNKLFDSWKNLYYLKKNRPADREKFWLAVKVEMVDNKLIEPIPFILHKENPTVKLNLKEDESGKIVGKISENSVGQSIEATEEYLKKIEVEKSSSSAVYKRDIQQISKEEWENAHQKKGKRAKISNDEKWPATEKHQQTVPKLMQSSINASQRQSKNEGQQKLLEHDRTHGKGIEISGDNFPKNKQKLPMDSLIPPHWPEYQENEANYYPRIVAGHTINRRIGHNAYEYGRKQHEFTQSKTNEFTQANMLSTNAGMAIGEWHQNLPLVQPTNAAAESMGGKQNEFTLFNSNVFTHQGNIPSINEAEDPMQFWQQILQENLPPKPTESMTANQHELSTHQINPSGSVQEHGPHFYFGKTDGQIIHEAIDINEDKYGGNQHKLSTQINQFASTQQKNIVQPMDETAEEHMQFCQQILNENLPTSPRESMAEIKHNFEEGNRKN